MISVCCYENCWSRKNDYQKAIGRSPNDRLSFDYLFLCLDNNAAERAIRPFAIGRKAWLVICF
ncbi:transposase [Pseudomonas syringae pv. maculicola]|nr:transposase [Pseudomonas syringae pv. maculicola]QQN30095.1 transposase [Pseudomonas syringae pv. maculicola]